MSLSDRFRLSERSIASRGSLRSNRLCPPGLEVLLPLSHVFIKQKSSDHVFTGYETRNKYILKTLEGKKVLWAIESTDECVRCCFTDSTRPFDLHIFNENKRKILKLSLPLSWFEPVTQLYVNCSSISTTIGRIENRTRFFHRPLYVVKDEAGNTAFTIKATSLMQCDEFKVRDAMGTEIGKIGKLWAPNIKESIGDDNIFGVEFPPDLEVKHKAVLLSACLWLDMRYHES
ncbi:phospholipid scramblase 2-like [Culicoides brevitarsis]|uniref:phospholipid scramblase 2-like n=1 Tax=Culicoides brevitarsis TaxID=469753 RepID=UPI00307B3B6A